MRKANRMSPKARASSAACWKLANAPPGVVMFFCVNRLHEQVDGLMTGRNSVLERSGEPALVVIGIDALKRVDGALGERRTDEFCKGIKQLTSSLDEMLDAFLDVFDRGNAVPRCVKSRYGKRRMRARAHCPSSVA
jgi:hypothetical protein